MCVLYTGVAEIWYLTVREDNKVPKEFLCVIKIKREDAGEKSVKSTLTFVIPHFFELSNLENGMGGARSTCGRHEEGVQIFQTEKCEAKM